MNSTDDFILFVLSYVPPNSKKQYQTFCQSSHEILGYHTIIRLFFVFCYLYWYCTLTYSFCFKGQVKTIYNVNLRCIPMIILLGNILQSLKQIKQLIDVASMCCKSHIKMRRRRVVVPYLPHNTRGGYLPLSLPQVTVCVQDKLPVGSLPETSCAIVFRIISDISPIFYTQLQNIWVKAYLGKPWSCSQTVFFLQYLFSISWGMLFQFRHRHRSGKGSFGGRIVVTGLLAAGCKAAICGTGVSTLPSSAELSFSSSSSIDNRESTQSMLPMPRCKLLMHNFFIISLSKASMNSCEKIS